MIGIPSRALYRLSSSFTLSLSKGLFIVARSSPFDRLRVKTRAGRRGVLCLALLRRNQVRCLGIADRPVHGGRE